MSSEEEGEGEWEDVHYVTALIEVMHLLTWVNLAGSSQLLEPLIGDDCIDDSTKGSL